MTPFSQRFATLCVCLLATFGIASAESPTKSEDASLPRIVRKDGRYALFVDGAPYLVLGVQVNNSSAWPAMLPKVWPAVEALHANTVEMPIYWEQFEPKPGAYDTSVLDTLVAQAREHDVRLVLLWFGTWKNGSSHYMPEWLKRDPEKAPRVVGADGKTLDSPSPFAPAALDADTRAFTALMRHLRESDPQHTVLMVQVENESGTWGTVRDYSPAAQKAFAGSVPAELLAALGRRDVARTASWTDAFGADAEEFFHAWSVARYIGTVAAAGKAVNPLPLYTNAAVRDPLNPGRPPSYESGGPTDNVLAIWKAAAPTLDFLAPDIYMPDSARYLKVLELYDRPDNALFVAESSSAPAYARYVFAALDRHAIGFATFGLDFTGYSNGPLGAAAVTDDLVATFALNYRLLGPIQREIARLNFEGKVDAVVEEPGKPSQTIDLGPWTATVSYGLTGFGPADHPPGNSEPVGRALVAKLGENEYLVTGLFSRVDFRVADAASGKQRAFIRVEEVTYDGAFHPIRLWNGDQTDWGLNFGSEPRVLRVSLGTF